MNTLSIGQLAKASDVGIEAIRFYEREGLLPVAARTASGYRYFPSHTVQRLHFIRRAKDLGFTLKEISELLGLHDDQHADRLHVKKLTTDKLQQIEQKIDDLQRMQAVLATLIDECSGQGPVSGCPIIQALAEPNSQY